MATVERNADSPFRTKALTSPGAGSDRDIQVPVQELPSAKKSCLTQGRDLINLLLLSSKFTLHYLLFYKGENSLSISLIQWTWC